MLNPIDLSRTDLNLLVLFEIVMRERHVGRAAQRMNLSPSAVSHGLGRLRTLLADPLFIKTPRGVAPTDRALALETPIAEVLAGVRKVVETSAPFDPHTSTRAFTIGAPDATAAVFLPPLVMRVRKQASRLDIRIRGLMPQPGAMSPESAWRQVFSDLDARTMDVAVLPVDAAPARFAVQTMFREDFVIAARSGHAWLEKPTLSRFLAADHVLVSQTGDPNGFVDIALAERGLQRRVALTAPNFMLALALIAQSDFLVAIPRSLFALHGPRFRLRCAKPPFKLPIFDISAVAPRPALQDAGVSWLVGSLAKACAANTGEDAR